VHTGDPLHSGRGLWLARQLCDRVEAFPTRDGFTVLVANEIPLAGDPANTALSAGIRSEVAAHHTANARAQVADLLSRATQLNAAQRKPSRPKR
jgi:hypothetical protein